LDNNKENTLPSFSLHLLSLHPRVDYLAMKNLLLLFVLLSSQVFGQGGLGSVVLPGNATCENEYINVSPCGGLTTLTYNGYTYDLVEIGGQCWFRENLQTTTYRDGSPIDYPDSSNATWENNATGAYAWYNNDSTTYASDYGALYNWHAVVNPSGLCPAGWQVATDCEWMYLEGTLGMSTTDQDITGWRGTDEGGKLKDTGTTHWDSSSGATNSSGFTGLPGGLRYATGLFYNLGTAGGWWSSSELNASKAWYRIMDDDKIYVGRWDYAKVFGFSIRCIKDSAEIVASLKETKKVSALYIYPNPVTNYLVVQPEHPSTLTLYNAQGQLLLTKEINHTHTLNTSHLSKGIYFLRATNERGVYSQKVVKE